jgi:hypothetical protein
MYILAFTFFQETQFFENMYRNLSFHSVAEYKGLWVWDRVGLIKCTFFLYKLLVSQIWLPDAYNSSDYIADTDWMISE